MIRPATAPEAQLRPLTARSVVLSVLLGAHPPELPVRDLVRYAEDFDISDSALRVALSRMVAAGDLDRSGSVYRLSGRLIERQRRQDSAVRPLTVPWDGSWELIAVIAIGRTPTDRAALRTRLVQLRLAELREGLWLRPANLTRPWPGDLDDLVRRFAGQPLGDPYDLVESLWDLDAWAESATSLLRRFRSARTPAERFTLAAGMLRALLADPVLPDALLNRPTWPADTLRSAYQQYQAELTTQVSDHRSN